MTSTTSSAPATNRRYDYRLIVRGALNFLHAFRFYDRSTLVKVPSYTVCGVVDTSIRLSKTLVVLPIRPSVTGNSVFFFLYNQYSLLTDSLGCFPSTSERNGRQTAVNEYYINNERSSLRRNDNVRRFIRLARIRKYSYGTSLKITPNEIIVRIVFRFFVTQCCCASRCAYIGTFRSTIRFSRRSFHTKPL